MRHEHDPQPAPYWQLDRALDEVRVDGERAMLRLQLHTAVEAYTRHHELTPLRHPAGERIYVQARPYILEPMFSLTISASTRLPADGTIGTVESAAWEGLRHRELGTA